MMRTTINIPDDVGDVIRSFADARGISLGEAVAQLVRRGLLPQQLSLYEEAPFPRFAVPEGAAPITLDETLAAEDEA
jgi:hypothetical protein